MKNRITKREYETPQFTYMRMAMALAEKEPKEARLKHAKNYYMLFSKNPFLRRLQTMSIWALFIMVLLVVACLRLGITGLRWLLGITSQTS